MLIQINVGGIDVTFGEPLAPNKPEPFYPYLESVEPITDATGEETGSAGFSLSLKAQRLIELNVRRSVKILDDDLSLVFEGIIGRIAYKNAIDITVEA